MNYFPLLVQEEEVKIPAPVSEGVACTATAAAAPPPPSVVLHGKFDCLSRLYVVIFFPALFLAFVFSNCL